MIRIDAMIEILETDREHFKRRIDEIITENTIDKNALTGALEYYNKWEYAGVLIARLKEMK